MIEKLTTTYKNNVIGTIAGVAAGYYLAKKLGYDKYLTLIPFMLVGSITGSNLEAYLKAKKSVPTAAIIK
jgi:uncharacterized membrane protein YfcA